MKHSALDFLTNRDPHAPRPAENGRWGAILSIALLLGSVIVPLLAAPAKSVWALAGTPQTAQGLSGAASVSAATPGHVLFEDDFHSRRHWKEGLGGACKTAYADVGFIVEDVPPPGSCEFDLTQAGYFRGNFRVELTARLRRGELNGGFGLKFGMATNDNRSYYTFGVTGNGGYLLAGWNGSWRALIKKTSDPVVQQGYGAPNQLAVEIRGRTIQCYINGKPVGSYDAPEDVRGTIGLNLDLMGTEVVFTDLRVVELGALVTPVPELAVVRPLFEDDLVAKHNWPELADRYCKTWYGEDGFVVANVGPEGTCEITLDKVGTLPANARMEVSVALRKGSPRSSFGLKFGRPAQDNNLFYTFTLNADGSYRLSQLNQAWRYPIDWTNDPVVKKGYGAINRLAVEIYGRTIRCYINDKLVGATAVTTDLRGDAGLFLARPGMEAVFSNLRVFELAAK